MMEFVDVMLHDVDNIVLRMFDIFTDNASGSGYQVVQMNTAYVTSVNSASNVSPESSALPGSSSMSGSSDIYSGEHSDSSSSSGRRSDTPVPVCRGLSGSAGYLGWC